MSEEVDAELGGVKVTLDAEPAMDPPWLQLELLRPTFHAFINVVLPLPVPAMRARVGVGEFMVQDPHGLNLGAAAGSARSADHTHGIHGLSRLPLRYKAMPFPASVLSGTSGIGLASRSRYE